MIIDLNTPWIPSSMVEWTSLAATGVCIDAVSLNSDPTPEEDIFGSIERIWLSTILAAGHIPQWADTRCRKPGSKAYHVPFPSTVTIGGFQIDRTRNLYTLTPRVNLSVENTLRNQPVKNRGTRH